MKEILEKYCGNDGFVGEYYYKFFTFKIYCDGDVYLFYSNDVVHRFNSSEKLEMFFKSLK